MQEVWKDVIGYEGSYQVSNYGKVRSLTRKVSCMGGQRTIKGKLLKPTVSSNLYLTVDLRQHQKHKTQFIHRLVAQAFIPNPKKYNVINHKDNNPQNNIVTNLEWCTQSYNVKYSYTNGNAKPTSGCFKKGYIPYNLKKVSQYDKEGNLINTYDSVKLAAKSIKRTPTSIFHCLAGRTKYTAGCIWRYADN